jgi:hypothetical protein
MRKRRTGAGSVISRLWQVGGSIPSPTATRRSAVARGLRLTAHRQATRADARSIARLTARDRSAPAARGSTVGAGSRFATGAERVQTGG